MSRRRSAKELPLHCSWNIDRHGKARVRFRKGGFSTYLTSEWWTEEFRHQYEAALAGAQFRRDNIGIERTRPGSFDELIVAYYRSADFFNLKPSTQRMRRNIIERFRQDHGTKPVRKLERKHLKAIMASKAATPDAANNLLKVLRTLLDFAIQIDLADRNVAADVSKFTIRSEGIHTWSEAENDAFDAHWPIGTKPRLAKDLLLWTGQRRSDVVRMGWQHCAGDWLTVRQEKTGAELSVPIAPELMASLTATPRTNLTFLVTELGAPFTAAGFGNWFRDQCDAAGLKQCSAHGLRKLAATRLANAGCSTDEIRAITGHRSRSEVDRYTRAANQRLLAQRAAEKMGAESERQMSNFEKRLDKKERK